MAVANQYGIDLAGIQQGWGNTLRDMVMQKQIAQMDREAAGAQALSDYGPAAMRGDTEALGNLYAKNPTAGGTLMAQLAKMQKEDRERTMKEAPVVSRLLGGVNDQETYVRAMEGLNSAGIAMKSAPMRYDPNWVNTRLTAARAMTAPDFHFMEGANGPVAINKETLAPTPIEGVGRKPDTEIEKLLAFKDSLKPTDPYRKIIDQAIAKATTDQSLVEIHDPNSPTGTKWVPRSQAIGQPGKPASGLALRTNPDGSVEVVQGRNAGSTMFGQKATNDIETNLVNTAMRIGRVGDIISSFDPSFLTIKGQVSNWSRAALEKISPEMLDDESRKQLTDFTTFRARAYNDLTQTLKEISGGAVTPQEAERNLKVLGDANNDSPTQFMAKVREVYRSLRMAQARLHYLKSNGTNDLKSVPLERLPAIMQQRETALANEIKQANPGMGAEALRDEVKTRLQNEFGL